MALMDREVAIVLDREGNFYKETIHRAPFNGAEIIKQWVAKKGFLMPALSPDSYVFANPDGSTTAIRVIDKMPWVHLNFEVCQNFENEFGDSRFPELKGRSTWIPKAGYSDAISTPDDPFTTVLPDDMRLLFMMNTNQNTTYIILMDISNGRTYAPPMMNIYEDGKLCAGENNMYYTHGEGLNCYLDRCFDTWVHAPWNNDLIDAGPSHASVCRFLAFDFDTRESIVWDTMSTDQNVTNWKISGPEWGQQAIGALFDTVYKPMKVKQNEPVAVPV